MSETTTTDMTGPTRQLYPLYAKGAHVASVETEPGDGFRPWFARHSRFPGVWGEGRSERDALIDLVSAMATLLLSPDR